MSLPAGASITSIGGKRCTAVPKAAAPTSPPPQTSAAPSIATASIPTVAPVVSTAPAVSPSTSNTPSVAPASANSPVIAAQDSTPDQSTHTPVPIPTTSEASSSPISTSSPETIPATVSPSATSDPIGAASLSQAPPPTSIAAIVITTSHTSSESAPISSIAVAQSDSSSEASSSSTSADRTFLESPTAGVIAPSPAAGHGSADASPTLAPAADTDTSHGHKMGTGPIMGLVMGVLALVGIVLFLLWFYTKKRRSRDSLLTPLHTQTFEGERETKYEIDGDSLGPTPRGKRWKAQAGGICSRLATNAAGFGSTVKGKLSRDNDAPSVNLNRGNSQFLEPILQHSRTNSAASGGQIIELSTRERFAEWWGRLLEDVNFNWRLRAKTNEPLYPATSRGMTGRDSGLDNVSPDFSHFLVMKNNELGRAADGHRRSQSTATLPQLGSLGLDFRAASVPLRKPSYSAQPTLPDLSKPPAAALAVNPFADPMEKLAPSAPRINTSDYVSNVRRSRGLSQVVSPHTPPLARLASSTGHSRSPSVSGPNQPSAANLPINASCHYPPTIRTSQSSYLDPPSAISTPSLLSGRHAKGRSDPFDLERPDLWAPPPVPSQSQAEGLPRRGSNASSLRTVTNAAGPARGPVMLQHARLQSVVAVASNKPRVVSAADMDADADASSKYSSGVSAMLSEWGDPGPDLGPVTWSGGRVSGPMLVAGEREGKRKDSAQNVDTVDTVGMAL